jgi:hypothetical protein
MFKRVKTIGLLGVGLLAMLGTKAEAHYIFVNGKWVWHSVGCQSTIGDLPNPPDPLIAKCDVITIQVDARCPDLSIVSVLIEESLTAQKQIPPGLTTFEVIVPVVSLLNNGNIVIACGGTPNAILIRDMVSTVTIQCVGPSASCPAPLVTTSTKKARCWLPYDFGDYPPPSTPPSGSLPARIPQIRYCHPL